MKTILYSKGDCELKDQISGLIENQLPLIQVVPTDSIQHFSETICRPLSRISVAIVIIHSPSEIDELLSDTHLFDNIRLILVLPDQDTGTIKTGLKLSPSYISHIDSDFEDILSVLKKIWQQHKAGSSNIPAAVYRHTL